MSYCYNGYAFIDLSLTFGFAPAAQECMLWTTGMQRAFEKRWPAIFTPTNWKIIHEHQNELQHAWNETFAAISGEDLPNLDKVVEILSSSPLTRLDGRTDSPAGHLDSNGYDTENGVASKTQSLSVAELNLEPTFKLDPIPWIKHCVYMDDDLESDSHSPKDVIDIMAFITHKVFQILNVKSTLKEGDTKKMVRYLGWLICLERKAIKLPMDKRKTLLDRLNLFKNGKVNLLTNKSKKTPFLYNAREIGCVAGSMNHFIGIHPQLKPLLTPIYRLCDPYKLDTRAKYNQFRSLKIQQNKWLMRSLNTLQEAIYRNEWVPFAVAANCFGKTKTAIHTYADAAGEPDYFNPAPFGCGGISEDLGFAWQCRRGLYLTFLKNVNDTQTNELSINTEELMAQLLNMFLIFKYHPQLTRCAI